MYAGNLLNLAGIGAGNVSTINQNTNGENETIGEIKVYARAAEGLRKREDGVAKSALNTNGKNGVYARGLRRSPKRKDHNGLRSSRGLLPRDWPKNYGINGDPGGLMTYIEPYADRSIAGHIPSGNHRGRYLGRRKALISSGTD